jgi:ornithine cyclodeaminase/alanine dehydrogenase-like protein (mu-crystallin family)
MLILDRSNLQHLLPMSDVIDAVEQGFRELGRNGAVIPDRLSMLLPPDQSGHEPVLLAMPAFLMRSEAPAVPVQSADQASSVLPQSQRSRLLGTKLVTVFPGNSSRNLEVIQAAYLLLDGETGSPLALMDGRFITAIRTAATSAVATRYLAPAGPKRLGIFGAGVQAEFHAEAMAEICGLERILICSRTAGRAEALATRLRALYKTPCEVVAAEVAVTGSNLLCTCTGSPAPLFDGKLIAPGTHVNAVGSFSPTTRELDSEAVRRSRLIIDAESAAGREAGEIAIAMREGAIQGDHVAGSLSDLVSFKVRGRNQQSEITLFKSCGLAIEDLVTAGLAYQRAVASGIGTRVEF